MQYGSLLTYLKVDSLAGFLEEKKNHFCGDCFPELKFGMIDTFYQSYLLEYTMGTWMKIINC